MMKVAVLYGQPSNPEAFETYYVETHLPLVSKMKGVERLELTQFSAGPQGEAPAYCRMAELYFRTREAMMRALESPEGKAAIEDLSHFATGGVTIALGTVER